jgi:hypothetical protein
MPSTPSNTASVSTTRSPAPSQNVARTLGVLMLVACSSKDADVAPGDSTCRIDVSSELSSAIPTVGIVTWSTNLSALDAAQIEFGQDTNYGAVAPVDLKETNHRTLLLGMTTSTEYHFRVVASAGSTSCVSDDHTLTTGPIDNGLALPSIMTHAPDEVAPGFLIASRFEAGGPGPGGGIRTMPPGAGGEGGGPGGIMFGGGGGVPGEMVGIAGASGGIMMGGPEGDSGESLLYVLNQAGEAVWWRTVPIGEVTRVLMSYDGKSMLAMSLNVAGTPSGRAVKVSMDGLDVETISVPNAHHDFTITPDGDLVFIRKSEDECDDITRLSNDGEWTRVFRVADAFGSQLGTGAGAGGERCHTNSLHYNANDDSFTFSVLNMNSYVKVSATGELQWILGGVASQFGGDGAEWERQHGHQMLDAGGLLFFNNRDLGAGDEGSLAIEVKLDQDTGMAERVWTYDGGVTSPVLGDVQRLPNGNTLVTYSASGVIHQANAVGTLVQELTWAIGGAIGYVNHRPTLYGPPALP